VIYLKTHNKTELGKLGVDKHAVVWFKLLH